MRDRSNRMDACLNGNKNKSDNGKPRQSVANRIVNGAGLIWIIAIGAALLVSAGPAFGQFTVQPMKLELAVTPGKLIKSILRVQSFDPNEITKNRKISFTAGIQRVFLFMIAFRLEEHIYRKEC